MTPPTPGAVTVEVRSGPVLRATLDALDLVTQVLPLVPEWYAAERDELAARVETAAAVLEGALKAKP